MAVSTVSNVGSMDLGKILKIVSKGMVYDNLSQASPLWDYIYGKKADDAEGRELRYSVRTALGPAAAQFIGVTGAQFPTSQKASILEATANYKKFAVTIEVENSLVELATKDLARYGEPIAEEIEAKGIAMARQLSASLYRDGTGVIGTVASVTTSGGKVVVTLSATNSARGFVGWFDKGDRVKIYTSAGVSHNEVNGGTEVTYFQVASRSRSANTVTLTAVDANGAAITATSLSGDDVAANDLIYRQGVAANDIASLASSSERNALSVEWAGLEALTSSSAMTVHGLLHGTDVEGSRFDAGGDALTPQDFQECMSQLMIACGQGRYKYKEAFMANEALDALVESNETDRRFQVGDAGDRGFKSLGYQWGEHHLTFKADEFCPKTRIWLPPEGDVLQYVGTDFQPVKARNGDEFHLKTGSGTHYDVQQMYMSGRGVLICVHPAAVGVINNFTI
jgi:hypothetical protein